MSLIRLVILFFLIMFMTCPAALSQDLSDDPEARRIFEEMDRRRDKITWETADLQMVIYDSRGRTRNRELKSYNYESDPVSKSLLVFASPANIRDTGFLTLSEGSDELQKLYLPALGRIRVISASEKSDRFMGSDFTYEDLGDQDPEDYRFQLGEKQDTTFVLHARKIDESQYSSMIFYIEPDRYVLQKVEYFDRDGKLFKRLVSGNYQKVLEEVWRPNFMVMYDLKNDRKTELTWRNRNIGDPIPGWRFTERGLRRGIQ